jgi:hypothetical protein
MSPNYSNRKPHIYTARFVEVRRDLEGHRLALGTHHVAKETSITFGTHRRRPYVYVMWRGRNVGGLRAWR